MNTTASLPHPPSNLLFLVYANSPLVWHLAFWKHLFTGWNWARWLVKEFSRHIPLRRSPRGHPRIPVWHQRPPTQLYTSAQICIWQYPRPCIEPVLSDCSNSGLVINTDSPPFQLVQSLINTSDVTHIKGTNWFHNVQTGEEQQMTKIFVYSCLFGTHITKRSNISRSTL